jgi:hypothetical protein
MAKEIEGSKPNKAEDRWVKELQGAKRRLDKFHKLGQRIVRRFTGDCKNASEGEGAELNIFNANVSVLQSMLFGTTPQVQVSRRFADSNDDVARVSALMLQRILQLDIEAPGSTVSDVLKQCLQDRLLPGLGIARVRYEVTTEKKTVEAVYDDMGQEIAAAYEDEVVSDEAVITDYVHWRDFAWGWGRTWATIPWVGFRAYMTRDEAIARFGEAKASKLQYQHQKIDDQDGADQQDVWATAPVWEIWCREEKKVYWHSGTTLLEEQDDPLGLPGFFPCPMPLIANLTTTEFKPTPDFFLAQDLYNSVDILQTRITLLTQALRVVGVYDKSNDGLKRMLTEATENDMIPVDNWAMFAEKGGMRGTVDWLPIDVIATVLEKLIAVRNDTLNLLYEVTGMSDILRGSGDQYTSAAAEKLKAKFASIRVQAIQDRFADFASQLMTFEAVIISNHFSPETIARKSNIQYSEDAKFNPELIPAAIQLIKDSDAAAYRVKIRPESVAMVDYAQLKAERTEYLTALSTFLQSGQAVMKQEPGAAPFLLKLMQWGLAGFRGSDEIEGVIDRAVEAMEKKGEQPPQPTPEQIKAQAEQQKAQLDIQKQMMKAAQEMQAINAKLQAELMTIKAETEGRILHEMVETEANIAEAKGKAQYAG